MFSFYRTIHAVNINMRVFFLFAFQTHMLYLALDNLLQDCSQLPTGDVSDTQLVQDYKKLSKKSPTPNTQNVSILLAKTFGLVTFFRRWTRDRM